MKTPRIRELRVSLNMSQASFADSIDISHTSMSAYENGKKKPPLETLLKIADMYNVSLDWLCARSDKQLGEVKTETDALQKLIEISKVPEIQIDINKGDFSNLNFNNPIVDPSGKIEISSRNLPKFLYKWSDILTVYNNGTINEELYELWCDNEIKQFGTQEEADD